MIDTAGMGERIKQIIDSLNMTQTEFAQILNISPSMVSKICSGVAEPSPRTQYDICDKFGVDRNWLETGEGEIFYKESDYDRVMNFFHESFTPGFLDPIYSKFILAISECSPKELRAIQKFASLLQGKRETTPENSAVQKETPPEDPEA